MPKVDVRSAVFHDGRLLLVEERIDGRPDPFKLVFLRERIDGETRPYSIS